MGTLGKSKISTQKKEGEIRRHTLTQCQRPRVGPGASAREGGDVLRKFVSIFSLKRKSSPLRRCDAARFLISLFYTYTPPTHLTSKTTIGVRLWRASTVGPGERKPKAKSSVGGGFVRGGEKGWVCLVFIPSQCATPIQKVRKESSSCASINSGLLSCTELTRRECTRSLERREIRTSEKGPAAALLAGERDREKETASFLRSVCFPLRALVVRWRSIGVDLEATRLFYPL